MDIDVLSRCSGSLAIARCSGSLAIVIIIASVLNWGRASKTTIQPLENLQNKAVKFLKTSNKATLDEIYIQNNILTINNLFKMSAGTFMHSYENN